MWILRFHIEPLRQGETHFIGIGGNVGWIHEGNVARFAADSANEVIQKLGLDNVTQLMTAEIEVALHGGRPEINGGLDVASAQRFMADAGRSAICAGKVGFLAAGVERFAQCDFGNDAPTAAYEGQRKMRVQIEPAHVANVEAKFRAPKVAD